VCIDGQDVRSVTQASLRTQIGIVPQESLLFGGTIHENILFGRLDATEAEIIEAARAANAHDFITALPMVMRRWWANAAPGSAGGSGSG